MISIHPMVTRPSDVGSFQDRTREGTTTRIRDYVKGKITAAIAIPGDTPRFALVGNKNLIYMLEKSDKNRHWEVHHIDPFMNAARKDMDGTRDTFAIAAPRATEIVVFDIKTCDGFLTRLGSRYDLSGTQEPISLAAIEGLGDREAVKRATAAGKKHTWTIDLPPRFVTHNFC